MKFHATEVTTNFDHARVSFQSPTTALQSIKYPKEEKKMEGKQKYHWSSERYRYTHRVKQMVSFG